MAKWWDRTKTGWALIGHAYLARDVGTTIGLWTALGVIASPLLVKIFTPLSLVDILIVATIGGVIAFFLAKRFAPKARHAHHLSQSVQVKPVASLKMEVIRAPINTERDTVLADALAYAVTARFDRKSLFENEAGAITQVGGALKKFEQYARDGKLHVWGKLEDWSVFDPIPPEYWSNHSVNFLDLLRGIANIERDGSPEPHYRDIRVSRAEIERLWPKGGSHKDDQSFC